MGDFVGVLDLYTTPSDVILKNRKRFYGLRRKSDESPTIWLKRVQNAIKRCNYPSLIEFFLIDKFICGLINTEKEAIQSASTWSLKRIAEFFSESNVDDKAVSASNFITLSLFYLS